jgi:hypothetical protein
MRPLRFASMPATQIAFGSPWRINSRCSDRACELPGILLPWLFAGHEDVAEVEDRLGPSAA